MKENPIIAVVGLGYVGLPLAVCFASKFEVIGFDCNTKRISELEQRSDHTGEITVEQFETTFPIKFTASESLIEAADLIVVTVPTPVDEDKRPNLKPVKSACLSVGRFMKKGAIVVFESTVFPGCTEEVCVPILEELSGLRFNQDFFVGYSPERINPGDPNRRIETIVKVTSGSTPEVANYVDSIYGKVITAGTYQAASIKVAEAAKVIENTQRDLNIALVNELAIIFNKMHINTHDVLEAAATKWNFLPFQPGLVGGHCIGVDPYYLTHKAERVGYRPEVILAGRRINDNMPHFVAGRIIKNMIRKNVVIADAKALVLGVTFKENCPDIRNSKVFDLIQELTDYEIHVDCFDPVADSESVMVEHGIALKNKILANEYDVAVFAVAHKDIVDLGPTIAPLLKQNHVIYDLKNIIDKDLADECL